MSKLPKTIAESKRQLQEFLQCSTFLCRTQYNVAHHTAWIRGLVCCGLWRFIFCAKPSINWTSLHQEPVLLKHTFAT